MADYRRAARCRDACLADGARDTLSRLCRYSRRFNLSRLTMPTPLPPSQPVDAEPAESAENSAERAPAPSREVGGPKGPEPTRYGDWEKNGRCIDF
jgi:hypothetical protein